MSRCAPYQNTFNLIFSLAHTSIVARICAKRPIGKTKRVAIR
jgi:hypothetical protein